MRHFIALPPAAPVSSWIARIALVAAILGSAVTFIGVGLFDPFGARQAQADAVSRDTVAVVLCALVETNEERARTLQDAPGMEADAQRARTSAASLRQLAEDLLQRTCGPPGRTVTTVPQEAP